MAASTASRITAAVAAALAVGVIGELVRRRRGRIEQDEIFTEEPTPPVPLSTERTGTATDRGDRVSYGLDVEALRGAQGFEPVVEYLTYIQSQRGDGSHLLFVRYDDLDVLARREGQEVSNFLERLDQLGVVVSNN